MSEQAPDTMQIDFKGIRLTIKLGKWAMEQYAFEMARVLLRYPDFNVRQFGEISAATLLCCGYINFCKDTGEAIIYNWEDFYRQVVVDFTTPEKSDQLKQIFNKYLNLHENG